MKRLSSWALPIILGVAGVALIIIGSLDLGDDPTPSLPAIADPEPGGAGLADADADRQRDHAGEPERGALPDTDSHPAAG